MRDNYHTVLMARNMAGVLELNELITKSCDKEHSYYTNRISFDEFLNISDNIISTSACLASPLNKLPQDHPRYMELARKYDFFEVQAHNHPDQIAFNKRLLSLSRLTGTPLIAGTDTHSSTKYKAECRAALMAAKGKSYGDEDAFDLTYKTYDELVEMFRVQGALPEDEYMQAIRNTHQLYDLTEDIELDTSIKYPILYGSREADSQKFTETVYKKLEEKLESGVIPRSQEAAFREAIEEELRVFRKLKMDGFMLSMSELISWCKEQGMAIGTARGSVGGSRVAYVTDVIDLNPETWHTAISKAIAEVTNGAGDNSLATVITNRLDSRYRKRKRAISVEEIQDDIETELMKEQAFDIAKAYVRYRYQHEINRNGSSIERKILTIVDGVNEEVIQENSNKNPTILSTQRDYMAGEVSREITNNTLLPKDILNAHEKGLIHFHDSDYFVQRMPNCCLVNIEDMLQNGTVISDTLIEKPHSFSTACNVTTQAVAQIASNQYGGQSISLTHLAPFVDVSRQKIRKDVEEEIAACNGDINSIDSIVEKRLRDEIKRGVQTIQYQVLTLMTTNGQTPFITVFMYLGEAKDERTKEDLAMIIEEVVRQRIQGVKNENGAWITPAFPKLIYVLEEDNIHEDSKYWYLTKLCAECSVKRLVPDYISEKMMLQNKVDVNGDGHCYPCMGCRSFLTPYLDEGGNPKYYGRFNQGVVTINLPDVGLSAVKQMEGITYIDDEQYQKRKEEIFWTIFEERLELCHRALRLRHERLLGTLSDASPIHWQNGGLARLKKGETIDKLLYGGYSTLSLGYAGLYECVKAMTGKSHTDDEAKPFALAIMQKMNDKCAEWKAAENIDYSLYGTPIESTTYKFAKCLQSRFGVIEGITDKNYITNSYHVHVTEKINAFDKLRFESEFQQLSPGGAISYIETANLSDNVEAALSVIKYIYYHIMYAELNTKSDFCQECGYDGEIQIVENEDGKLIWKCPNCGNTNRTKMNIARRTCGYIGVNDFNQGRTQEIKERYVHLGGE